MNDDELILRRKKQNADRARAYRKRKKELEDAMHTVRSGEPVSENIVIAKLLHEKQLNAERCRKYRQKCKQLKSGANFNGGTSESDSNISTLKKSNKEENSPSGNEIKVFCPNCNTEVQHTAEGIQEDQKKILIAKVYHYFECEYEELKKMYGDLDLTPLSKFCQRTALATGVTETTVLQILKEEEERNAEERQEKDRSGARKRSIQTESSSEDESSDNNVGDDGQPNFEQEAQHKEEAEVETLVVKIEPEFDKDYVEIDPISVQVKAEPPDDDVENTNETLALPGPARPAQPAQPARPARPAGPAATKRKERKIPRRSDVTSTQQSKQGESSTSAASSSARHMEVLDESGLLGATAVKVEDIDIGEEEFS